MGQSRVKSFPYRPKLMGGQSKILSRTAQERRIIIVRTEVSLPRHETRPRCMNLWHVRTFMRVILKLKSACDS